MGGRIGEILVARGDLTEAQLRRALRAQDFSAQKLCEILVARGDISTDQVSSAMSAERGSSGMLGQFLVTHGFVSEKILSSALAEQFQVEYKDIQPEQVNPQIVRLLPEELARDRLVVPIEVAGRWLTLAMVAPDDLETISEVELITGYYVDSVVATQRSILSTLDRGFDKRISARQTVVDMKFMDLQASQDEAEVEEDDAPNDASDAPVVRLVRSILIGAANAGASDIHLEPFDPQMRVRYRVDGQLQQVMTIPNHTEEAVIARIKVLANMDTTEKRRPQDGNLTIEENGTCSSFRISSIPTVDGEKVVLRIVDEGNRIFTYDALGMPSHDVEVLQSLTAKIHGMVIFTGPTGSGKTTTMYAMLNSMNAMERNISTVEDPVEHRLTGINQVHSNNEHGLGFANALKYLLRQDPDVIMVGEIRDHETATTAVQAALTGHLLISTLHTNDAVSSIARLNDLGIDKFQTAGALVASVAQRLLRAICPDCKSPCQPNQALLASLVGSRELPADATFYAGKGCGRCLGTGYIGRIPIMEIMQITSQIERAIEAGLPASKLRELAASEGMRALIDSGIEQALAGRTTIEEIYYKLSN